MIRINANTGLTERVPNNSQVNKFGPCKTATHGPCFLFTNPATFNQFWLLYFWNGYNYIFQWNHADPGYTWQAGATLSGCDFNKQVRGISTAGFFFTTPAIGQPIYFRI